MKPDKVINPGGVNGMGEATFSPETLAQLKAAIKTAAEQQSPEEIRENVLLAVKLRMLKKSDQ
jgi:hypothetical protein